MKRNNPFVLRRWLKAQAEPTPVALIRTYVDDEGRTIRVFDARYAHGATSRQTVKPKGSGRKRPD